MTDSDFASNARLPPLDELERLCGVLGREARVRTLERVVHDGISYPIVGVVLGAEDPSAPTLGLVGGVHGLERIGTEVVLAYLHTLVERSAWDVTLRHVLREVRVALLPLVNPVGMALGRRSNGRGVDLMRNAPAHPSSRGSFLVGGQRVSPLLPWYAGDGASMEPEARALCRFVAREILPSRASIVIDCHSGFGLVDRLWFPYARSRRPFPGLAEVVALHRLLERTSPHHVYRLEPQASAYTIASDLWDHLYDRHAATGQAGSFLPMTLEMGSWNWVRKNPRQLLSTLGGFNPVVPHRRDRTLRRHLPLFDFLLSAVASHERWRPQGEEQRRRLEDEGFLLWYGRR